MDILTLVKGLADGIGVAKNLHDGWEAISQRTPKHQLAEAEGPFLYPHYIDKGTWSRLLQALIEIRTERIDIFSRAKLTQAISAIFEIESIINSFRLNQHINRSLELRASYLRNDKILKKDREIFSQIESLSVDYSYFSTYLPRESDRQEISKIHGSKVFATPSYCAEIIAIESLNEKYDLNVAIDISRSSFIEASEYSLNQNDRERNYIIGVDVSCIHIMPLYMDRKSPSSICWICYETEF